MRKYLIILFLILTSCQSEKIDKADLDSFSDVEIKFKTGDENIELYSMGFYKSGNKIKAIKKQPFYYYGSATDSIWTKEIDKSDLRLLNRFIIKAKSIKDTCSVTSSSIDTYNIKTNGQEIKIVGNCDWNGIDYDSLEAKIFEHKFIELENKRLNVSDSLAESFNGTWDVSGWENGVLKNKNVVLTRTSKNELEKTGFKRWSFKRENDSIFKNQLDIDEGNTLIEIRGSMYKVIDVKNGEIQLEFLW